MKVVGTKHRARTAVALRLATREQAEPVLALRKPRAGQRQDGAWVIGRVGRGVRGQVVSALLLSFLESFPKISDPGLFGVLTWQLQDPHE